jgi:hypothetical protein
MSPDVMAAITVFWHAGTNFAAMIIRDILPHNRIAGNSG